MAEEAVDKGLNLESGEVSCDVPAPDSGTNEEPNPKQSEETSVDRGTTSGSDGGRKIFVGGLPWELTEDGLKKHFEEFGEVGDAFVMRHRATGKHRGFGFVIFTKSEAAEAASRKQHTILGRNVEVKIAVSRDDMNREGKSVDPPIVKTKKIFVGGLPTTVTDSMMKDHFEQYGEVVEATVQLNHETKRSRGFGFVVFESEATVDDVLAVGHKLDDKLVEVKRAEPKGPGGPFMQGWGPSMHHSPYFPGGRGGWQHGGPRGPFRGGYHGDHFPRGGGYGGPRRVPPPHPSMMGGVGHRMDGGYRPYGDYGAHRGGLYGNRPVGTSYPPYAQPIANAMAPAYGMATAQVSGVSNFRNGYEQHAQYAAAPTSSTESYYTNYGSQPSAQYPTNAAYSYAANYGATVGSTPATGVVAHQPNAMSAYTNTAGTGAGGAMRDRRQQPATARYNPYQRR